jgi:hypothetical protein
LWSDADEHSQSGECETYAHGPADQTKQDTLNEQPGGNPALARAQRSPNRKFLLAVLGTDE